MINEKSSFRFEIFRIPGTLNMGLYISMQGVDGKVYVAKPMQLEFEAIDENSAVDTPPSLKLDMVMADQFKQALADFLDQQGVKTKSDATLQGTVDAMRLHLEDMRSLVFNMLPEKAAQPDKILE